MSMRVGMNYPPIRSLITLQWTWNVNCEITIRGGMCAICLVNVGVCCVRGRYPENCRNVVSN